MVTQVENPGNATEVYVSDVDPNQQSTDRRLEILQLPIVQVSEEGAAASLRTGTIPKRPTMSDIILHPVSRDVRSDSNVDPRRQSAPASADLFMGKQSSPLRLTVPQSLQSVFASPVSANLSSVLRTPEFHSNFANQVRESHHNSVADKIKLSSENPLNFNSQPPPNFNLPPVNSKVPESNPAGNQIKMSEFVHVSEIEAYISKCINQMISQGPRCPVVNQAAVDHLVGQIANVGIQD